MHDQNFLLLDVGNSRMKWNLWQYGAAQFSRETQFVDYKSQDLDRVLAHEWGNLQGTIHAIYVANVAGQTVAQQISNWTTGHWGIDPRFVATSASFQSVKNGYRNYQELGVDRWLAVIAAHQLWPDQQAIVIDCGTATTLDALSSNGQHHAGPIMPGRQMMQQSLTANTADLKISDDTNVSTSVFAENTQNAIVSGVNFAASCPLNTIVSQLRQKLVDETGNEEVKVIVTGGAAAQLMPLTQINEFNVVSDLVLIGLRRLAEVEQ
ncbi:type III pantothenate kinase [Kaarinaea lacus]